MQLATQVYRKTKTLPRGELYSLVAQTLYLLPLCLSSYQIASGSLYELQTQLEICLNLGYLSKEDFEDINEQSREIERMLSSLIKESGREKITLCLLPLCLSSYQDGSN